MPRMSQAERHVFVIRMIVHAPEYPQGKICCSQENLIMRLLVGSSAASPPVGKRMVFWDLAAILPTPSGKPIYELSCEPANPMREFPLLLVALEWAINPLLPYWMVLGTVNWGENYKMLIMHPTSPFFPSFYVLLSFDFNFPLSRSLFSGHSCKPPLVSGVKRSSQTSGLWIFHSWHQKSCRGSLGPNSSCHTCIPHQHRCGTWLWGIIWIWICLCRKALGSDLQFKTPWGWSCRLLPEPREV